MQNTLFAEEIDSKKDRLAFAMVEEQYRRDPALLARWGERGRAKSLEDAGRNLEFLAAAVALGDPAAFARYALWLRKVLGGAGLGPHILRDHLALMKEFLAAGLTAGCAAAAAACVEQAEKALQAAPEAGKK
jgi:hypothetical protein